MGGSQIIAYTGRYSGKWGVLKLSNIQDVTAVSGVLKLSHIQDIAAVSGGFSNYHIYRTCPTKKASFSKLNNFCKNKIFSNLFLLFYGRQNLFVGKIRKK